MKRIVTFLGLAIVVLAASCQEPAKPTPPPPAKPAPVVEVAKPVDAGTADAHLGMMEKYALWKAKKEADEKLAKELAADEEARLRKFDKTKLATHLALLSFEKKTRKTLDEAAESLKGKPDAAAQMEKIADKQRKAIEAQAKILRKMDPTGGNSNIGTDHDVSLNLLANDYPAALAAAAGGDDKPLAEAGKELDKRFKKMESWLDEVKTAKGSKDTKEPSAPKSPKGAKTPKPKKKGKK
jgi:hypothetical protein